MGFVSEGEEFAVATTVAIGGETVGGTVGIEGEDATDLLLTVAVGGEETAGEATVDDLDLCAEKVEGGRWKEEKKGCTQLSMLALTISTSAPSERACCNRLTVSGLSRWRCALAKD